MAKSQIEPHQNRLKLAQIILGGQDGLVNVLGLILGLAAATQDNRIVLVGGLAAVFAESISMAAVAYTSGMADKDIYKSELEREKAEISQVPEIETEEIRQIYLKKGFSGKLLDQIVDHITSDKNIWLETMMREELQLAPIDRSDVIKNSWIVGASTITGSIIPLVPFLILPVSLGIVTSVAISALTLFGVGFYKGQKTLHKPWRSGLELLLIGLGAAILGYLVGLLFQIN